MKSILITGGSGFVGQNLLKHFRSLAGFNVNLLNARMPITQDLFQGTVFIHLAGKAHDLKKSSENSEYFKINTELTKDLFNLFLASDVKDFIYFSSVKAAADTVSGDLTENVVPKPVGPYGESKHKAEEYILSKQLPTGKRVFILRPCMIHGPGNKGNLNLLYKVVKKGLPYPLAAFKNERSFLSISNLVFIIDRIIKEPSIPGGIYNVADDIPLATNDVITIISEAIGLRSKLWSISPSIIKMLAKLGDSLHLPLNTERVKKLTESYTVSNEKIKRALDVAQLPTTSREGLLITIKSFSHTKS